MGTRRAVSYPDELERSSARRRWLDGSSRGQPRVKLSRMQGAELVSRGREAFARRAWPDAVESLSRADQAAPLGAEELELLSTSVYMLGRDDEHIRALERAHHAHLDAGDAPRAVHCAYWIGHNFMLRGEIGPARGW